MTKSNNTLQEALKLIRKAPRVTKLSLDNFPEKLRPAPKYGPGKLPRVEYKRGDRLKYQNYPPLGYVKGRTPLNIRTPKYPYYRNQEERREYYPVSLLKLQFLIDIGYVDASKPIDFGKLAVANMFSEEVLQQVDGFQLTEEGMERFTTPVFIETQYVQSEKVVAAIERCGGVLTTSFFDRSSLSCLKEPLKFFQTGLPIPPRLAPPRDLVKLV